MARYERLRKAFQYIGPPEKKPAPQIYGSEPSDLEVLLRAPSLYRTLLLINEYLQVKRRRGFTYRGLRAYWDMKGLYRDERDPAREWHTVERAIRKLAELGFLERRHPRSNKKTVIFYPTKRFWRVIEEREGLIDDG